MRLVFMVKAFMYDPALEPLLQLVVIERFEIVEIHTDIVNNGEQYLAGSPHQRGRGCGSFKRRVAGICAIFFNSTHRLKIYVGVLVTLSSLL